MLAGHQTAQTVTPNFKPATPIVERLAQAMVEANAHGGAFVEAMHDRGFTDLDLSMYGTQARQRANTLFVREIEELPAYDRPSRVSAAADIVTGLVNWPGLPVIITQLQARGFEKPELDDILHDVIAVAADRFAAEGGAL